MMIGIGLYKCLRIVWRRIYKDWVVLVVMSRDELRDLLGKGGIILVVVLSALSILNLLGVIG